MDRKLTDICKIQYGYAFDSSKFTSGEGVPLVRIRDVVRGYSETFTTEECSENYFVNDGDMLIGMDGEFNIAHWKGGRAYLNQRVCKLIPGNEVDGLYLYYFMPKALKTIEEKTPFVTVKHLSAKELNKIVVPVPNMQVQQRIAATLQKADELIALRKEQLAKLDELVKARFVEMFGDMYLNTKDWATVKLMDIADVVSGITKGRKVKEQELFEVPYMAVSNVKAGYIDWTTVKTIMATAQEINQYRLLPNDVLMTEGGDPDKVGRGAIIKNPLENSIHQNHIFRVRLDSTKILPVFFAEYLQHPKAKRYFLGCAKQTTGIASINMQQLRALPVLMPPLELQEKFTSFVAQTDKTKLTLQESLDRLEVTKKALLDHFFNVGSDIQ